MLLWMMAVHGLRGWHGPNLCDLLSCQFLSNLCGDCVTIWFYNVAFTQVNNKYSISH